MRWLKSKQLLTKRLMPITHSLSSDFCDYILSSKNFLSLLAYLVFLALQDTDNNTNKPTHMKKQLQAHEWVQKSLYATHFIPKLVQMGLDQ
uniref:Uncharacterized protein n=1 Tax=Anguilla anguilla TaxID=7936 RepID=A0A0E9TW97_ANGAN